MVKVNIIISWQPECKTSDGVQVEKKRKEKIGLK